MVPPRWLPRIKRRVFDYIASHPDCGRDAIISSVYADDRDGGPETSGAISVHICGINRILAGTGTRISWTKTKPATYRVVSDRGLLCMIAKAGDGNDGEGQSDKKQSID